MFGFMNFQMNASPINLAEGSQLWDGTRDWANNSSQIVFLVWGGVLCADSGGKLKQASAGVIEVLRHLLGRGETKLVAAAERRSCRQAVL